MATTTTDSLYKGYAGKFCAQCLDDIPTVSKATAYCKQCNEFICSDTCLRQHAKLRLSKSHGYYIDSDLVDFLQSKGYTKPGDINTDKPYGTEGGDTDNVVKRTLAVLRTEYNIRAPADREICSINACVVLDNGHIVLSDLKNSNLKLFHTKSRVCTSVLKFDKVPRDMCLSNKDRARLYAIETGVRGIHSIDASGDELKIVETVPTDCECFGVTCWKDGLAVTVSARTSFYGEYELRLLDYFGKVKKTINAKKTTDCNFNMPWYLSSNACAQRVTVSDFGNSTVTCFDVDGGIVFTYSDAATLIRPVSMATARNGDTFVVSQRGHCVVQLSPEGIKKGLIFSEDILEFPGAIALTNEEHGDQFILQCIGWSDRIQVFDIVDSTARPTSTD